MNMIQITRLAGKILARREKLRKQEKKLIAELVSWIKWTQTDSKGNPSLTVVSEKSMAKQLKISPQYFSDLKNGRRNVSDKVLKNIQDFLIDKIKNLNKIK